MMAGDSEYIWEMDTNESETENATMAAAEAEPEKSEDVGSNGVASEAKENKPIEAVVRRNKRGHIILDIERTFAVRASQEKQTSENEKQNKPEKKELNSETAKKKE